MNPIPAQSQPEKLRHEPISDEELHAITRTTLGDYDDNAAAFYAGTQDHDVSQNINALLANIAQADAHADTHEHVHEHAHAHEHTVTPPYRILDFGCGPGRDLIHFKALGHQAVGLDGSPMLVALARKNSDCEVWLQNFLALDLPAARFDGVFANASLFHVPAQALPDVLRSLWATLSDDGVLFASNPRGDNRHAWHGNRYGCFHDLTNWRDYVTAAGFTELQHYYRPSEKPRAQQPWLATVWRKISA